MGATLPSGERSNTMKFLRFLVVPVLALTLNVVVAAGATHAQDDTNNTFDINAFNWYCTTGSATCNVNNAATNNGYFCTTQTDTCAGLNYAAVQASGDVAGATNGTPGLVTLTCENFTGPRSFNAGYVNVSTSAFWNTWGTPGDDDYWVNTYSHGPWVNTTYNPNYYPSVIGGKATVISPNPEAYNTTSSVTLSAYDAFWHETGTVTGVQNADDTSGYDTPMGGQFRITISSRDYGLWHFTNNVPDYPYNGTISCTAGGPNATAIGSLLHSQASYLNPWATGSYGAEGEFDEYPLYEYDHNCAYAPILIFDPWTGGSCENLVGVP